MSTVTTEFDVGGYIYGLFDMSQGKISAALQKRNSELKKITVESTMQALLLLMKTKKYEDISISDICRKAGVSRNAFYKNFKTKDNVFMKIVLNFNKKYILRGLGNPFGKRVSLSWYIKFFNMVKQQSEFYLLLIESNFKDKYLDCVNKILVSDTTDKRMRYERFMWNGAMQNVAVEWILSGLRESPEEMAEICFSRFGF